MEYEKLGFDPSAGRWRVVAAVGAITVVLIVTLAFVTRSTGPAVPPMDYGKDLQDLSKMLQQLNSNLERVFPVEDQPTSDSPFKNASKLLRVVEEKVQHLSIPRNAKFRWGYEHPELGTFLFYPSTKGTSTSCDDRYRPGYAPYSGQYMMRQWFAEFMQGNPVSIMGLTSSDVVAKKWCLENTFELADPAFVEQASAQLLMLVGERPNFHPVAKTLYYD